MKLTIITPQSNTTVEVEKVSLPGSQGGFMVLEGHAPLISSLSKGQVRYEQQGQEHVLEVNGGLVEVNRNEVRVVVEQ